MPLVLRNTLDRPLNVGEFDGNFTFLDGKADGKASLAALDDLETVVDGKAPLSHAHVIADVTGLQPELDGKADIAGARDLLPSDGSLSGPVMVPIMGATPVVGGFMQFDAAGVAWPISPSEVIAALFPDGITAVINDELGGTTWQQGGGTSEPSQIGGSDWQLLDAGTDGDLIFRIITAPDPGSSAITKFQREMNASGSWIDLPAGTGAGDYTVAGFTNGIVYNAKVRAVNAVGPGPASTSKPATPSAPSYTSTLVDNQGGASIGWTGGFGANSAKGTFAFHGQFNSGPTGTHDLMTTESAGRFRVQYDYTTQNMLVRWRNASAVTLGEIWFGVSKDQVHTIAISVDATAPSVEVRKDGVLLANTGDVATGYQVAVALITGTIEWAKTGNGQALGGGNDVLVGELFLDSQRAWSTALFRDATGLQDWQAISDGAEQVFLGSGLSAAQWNSADANNPGVKTITNAGTFV